MRSPAPSQSRKGTPPRKQRAFLQLEANANREDIAECLVATGNQRASRLLDMMLDQAYDGLSFGQLCSRAGLSAMEVTRLFCQRQIAEGMMRLAYYLPDIMEQTALDAMGRSEKCGWCGGSGVVQEHTCKQCRGKGEVRIQGDIHRLRLVFQIAGLLPYKAGRP